MEQGGGDRQDLHEKIRVHSVAAGMAVKGEGRANDLLERLAADPAFAAVHGKLESLVEPSLFIGRAPDQVSQPKPLAFMLASSILPSHEPAPSCVQSLRLDSTPSDSTEDDGVIFLVENFPRRLCQQREGTVWTVSQ